MIAFGITLKFPIVPIKAAHHFISLGKAMHKAQFRSEFGRL